MQPVDMTQYAGSSSLNAADIGNKHITLTIKNILMESVGQPPEQKWCFYFEETVKKLIVNKTNLTVMIEAYGKYNTDWLGKKVVLYTAPTNMGPGIKIRKAEDGAQAVGEQVGAGEPLAMQPVEGDPFAGE